MVLLDSISKQALFVDEVAYETTALYLATITAVQEKGTVIRSITCDGRRGLDKLLPGVPMQLCHFHQVQTVNRYLTRRPKSVAACELRELALSLKNSTRAGFAGALEAWYERHKSFINERSTNPITGKSHYTHKRLRSAYNSLKRSLERLFTFERYPELNIHKTTNLLEGKFADLKRRLSCHQGMRKENKLRFIKDYLSIR